MTWKPCTLWQCICISLLGYSDVLMVTQVYGCAAHGRHVCGQVCSSQCNYVLPANGLHTVLLQGIEYQASAAEYLE